MLVFIYMCFLKSFDRQDEDNAIYLFMYLFYISADKENVNLFN